MPNIQKPNQHFDVITYTGNGKAVTVVGNAQISTAQFKFGGSSAYFDGIGDSLNIPDSSDFTIAGNNFTIEFWVRFNSVATTQTIIYHGDNAGTLSLSSLEISLLSSKLTGRIYSGSTSYMVTSSSNSAINTWYHVALVRNGGTLTLYVDGTSAATASVSGVSANDPADLFKIGNYTSATTGGNQLNGYIDDLRFYKGVAKYTANFTAPTGALAIGPTDPYWQYCVLAMPMDGTNGSTTFPTFAYNASTDLGLNFKPDLVWIKSRSAATDHAIYDSIRGVRVDSASNSNAAQTTQFNGLSQFNANGFTVGNLAKANLSSTTYAAWCWKAGNSTSTNTAGSVTSTVSVNPTAGFSVVGFNCPATGTFTVGHGLGVAPKFIVTRGAGATASSWNIFHASVCTTTSQYLVFQASQAINSITNQWGTALPTSSTVGMIANSTVIASQAAVMYAWSEVPGFSSFGSYTGNGNANGPFVNTGFRPAFVIIKASSGSGNWLMYDNERSPSNLAKEFLYANSSAAEVTDTVGIDMLSNGFKGRNTYNDANLNGVTYIYAAWAENPFNYALAR